MPSYDERKYSKTRTSNGLPLSEAVPGLPYFTPITRPAPGTYNGDEKDAQARRPLLLTPLKMRGTTFKNRVFLSPMAQYSAEPGTGIPTDFHFIHYGTFALRGVALVCTEACSVMSNGGITPEDVGIWDDKHIAAWRRITDFIHSQGGLAGVQLAHAGRRASTYTPTLLGENPDMKMQTAPPEAHGWKDIWSASAISYSDGKYAVPKEMTLKDIETFKKCWTDAVKRSIKAGFDVAEIHASHGYLLHNFESPLSNTRTDRYGGSLENRCRLTLEVTKITRDLWPKDKPIFCRVSGTDWDPRGEKDANGKYISWGIEQTTWLARELQKLGVDYYDITSGGNYDKQVVSSAPGYNAHLAQAVKKAVPGLLVGSVGLIQTAELAEEILREGKADAISLGRELLRNADFVLRAAEKFGAPIQLCNQHYRAITWKDTVIPGPGQPASTVAKL